MADKGGKPVIAVDAMGGDHGPGVVVPGAVNALRDQQNFTLALYGDEAAVRAQIATLATDDLSLKVSEVLESRGDAGLQSGSLNLSDGDSLVELVDIVLRN